MVWSKTVKRKDSNLRSQRRHHKIILKSCKLKSLQSQLFPWQFIDEFSLMNKAKSWCLFGKLFIFLVPSNRRARCCWEHDNMVPNSKISINKIDYCSIDLSISLCIVATQLILFLNSMLTYFAKNYATASWNSLFSITLQIPLM